MAWDSNRPVPWSRLMREWVLYVVIMGAIFVVFFRDDGFIGILVGLLVSGPLYLAIGYVLAKMGVQRRTLKDATTAPRVASTAPDDGDERPRPRPAPTKRTGGGTRPSRSSKRRR